MLSYETVYVAVVGDVPGVAGTVITTKSLCASTSAPVVTTTVARRDKNYLETLVDGKCKALPLRPTSGPTGVLTTGMPALPTGVTVLNSADPVHTASGTVTVVSGTNANPSVTVKKG